MFISNFRSKNFNHLKLLVKIEIHYHGCPLFLKYVPNEDTNTNC